MKNLSTYERKMEKKTLNIKVMKKTLTFAKKKREKI